MLNLKFIEYGFKIKFDFISGDYDQNLMNFLSKIEKLGFLFCGTANNNQISGWINKAHNKKQRIKTSSNDKIFFDKILKKDINIFNYQSNSLVNVWRNT